MKIKEINKFVKAIKEKEEIELNLSLFGNAVATKYTEFAMLNLSMSFYMDCETLLTNPYNAELKNIVKTVIAIVDNCIIKGDVSVFEKSIEKLDKLRGEISERVKLLTVYTDELNIYGKILEKKITKFSGEQLLLTDEEYAARILNYIFSEKDNTVVNLKVKDVVSKLPIRMSRSKFFDLVENALNVYKGNSLYNLNSFIEILESYAMVAKPNGYGEDFPKIHRKLQELQVGINDLEDQKKYKKICESFDKMLIKTEEISDSYIQAIKIINDLYSVLLVLPYVVEESKVIDNCTNIIASISKGFVNNNINEEQVDAMFESIEGEQEALMEEMNTISERLFDIVQANKVDIENLLLGAKFNSLVKAKDFYTNNLFMYVNQIQDTGEIVDDKQLKKAQESIINKLSESFVERNSEINWAVMSIVLSELPIFFKNTEEIKNYVINSLTSCRDNDEKLASISLILSE